MEAFTNSTILRFDGDLGLYERERFSEMLPPPEFIGRVVLDFTDVTSLDSAILAAIMIYRQRRIIAHRDPLDIIAIANERVQRLFDITGVSRSITVVPSQARDEFVSG